MVDQTFSADDFFKSLEDNFLEDLCDSRSHSDRSYIPNVWELTLLFGQSEDLGSIQVVGDGLAVDPAIEVLAELGACFLLNVFFLENSNRKQV